MKKKYVEDNDSRLSDSRTPTAHNQAQSTITDLVTDLAAKETPAGAQTKVDTHAPIITGIHGVGASNIESTSGSQAKVDAHKNVTTGVHGVGISSIENVADAEARIVTHNALQGPHIAATNLEKTSKKGTASGYTSLDANAKVPSVELGGAGADATKFLRGDQSWQVPPGGGTNVETHISMIQLAIAQTI